MVRPVMSNRAPHPAYDTSPRPLVLVPTCHQTDQPHPYVMVKEKYVTVLRDLAGVVPLLIPSLDPPLAVRDLLGRMQGLMLTGSPSNVQPQHYDGPHSKPETLHDPNRDAIMLPLIRAAVEARIPILAICRGCQELNVALGGSLHQYLQDLPDRLDHREPKGMPMEVLYSDAHEVQLSEGGWLADFAGALSARVNSLHSQGVDTLAAGLRVEALAPDGTIEAYRLARPDHYVLGIQWHPEWRAADNPLSRGIFESFGDACRQFAQLDSHVVDYAVV